MALIKYNAAQPPLNAADLKRWIYSQFRDVDRSLASALLVLEALEGAKIELGAPDSGGIGYTVLRIPNP